MSGIFFIFFSNYVSSEEIAVKEGGRQFVVAIGTKVGLVTTDVKIIPAIKNLKKETEKSSKIIPHKWKWAKRPLGSKAEIVEMEDGTEGFIADVEGEYEIALLTEVNGEFVIKGTEDTVKVSAFGQNNIPVAKAGRDQKVEQLSRIILNGTKSYDKDGDSLSYHWLLIEKPQNSSSVINNMNSSIAGFVPDMSGEYRVSLVVDDGKEKSQRDTVLINVCLDGRKTKNSLPVASAGLNQTISVGETVYIDGRESYDSDRDKLRYRWFVIEKPEDSLIKLSNGDSMVSYFKADVVGEYIIGLVVMDGFDRSAPTQVKIVASIDNLIPIANAGRGAVIKLGDIVTLNGTESVSRTPNSPLSYRWMLVSPSNVVVSLDDIFSSTPKFEPSEEGIYIFDLVVSNGNDVSQPSRVVIEVVDDDKSELKPVADAGKDIVVAFGELVNFNGLGSRSRKDDDSDRFLSYRWRVIDSPQQGEVKIRNSRTATPSLLPSLSGSYNIELIVNDGKQNSEPDYVLVVVTGGIPRNVPPVVYAGKNQIAYLGSTVLLNGGISGDAEAADILYNWTFIEKPKGSSTKLINRKKKRASFFADKVGFYRLNLKGNDGFNSDVDDIVIKVEKAVFAIPLEDIDNRHKYYVKFYDVDKRKTKIYELPYTRKVCRFTDGIVLNGTYIISMKICLNDAMRYASTHCTAEKTIHVVLKDILKNKKTNKNF